MVDENSENEEEYEYEYDPYGDKALAFFMDGTLILMLVLVIAVVLKCHQPFIHYLIYGN